VSWFQFRVSWRAARKNLLRLAVTPVCYLRCIRAVGSDTEHEGTMLPLPPFAGRHGLPSAAVVEESADAQHLLEGGAAAETVRAERSLTRCALDLARERER
jgi:hypothetical protein